MLFKIYFHKGYGVPKISLLFILSCLLVTIPSYFNNAFYDVFGGVQEPLYFWQNFTHNLEHGDPFQTGLPTLLHLSINIFVIAVCGILVEKVLGTTYFFVLTIMALTVSTAGRFLGIYGNGASTIAWSYAAVAFYSLILLIKGKKKELFRDPVFYIIIFILFTIWIVITLFNFLWKWHNSNTLHLAGVVTGFIATVLFRNIISDRINRFVTQQPVEKSTSKWDKHATWFALYVPVFVLTVLILAWTGNLPNQALPVEVTPYGSAPVSAINEANKIITFHFKESMLDHINQTSVTIGSSSDEPLTYQSTWQDSNTYIISFNRSIQDSERIEIYLKGFYDAEGHPIPGEVKLYYGEQH